MHYYRCLGCLMVITVKEQLGFKVACDVCGSERFEHMGRVHNNRLVGDGTAPACDARCTNAAGPECNCQCNSANHGSGRTVNVIYDQGAIPRLSPDDTRRAKHLKMFEEFQQAKRDARSKSSDLLNSGWIDKKLWVMAKYGVDRAISQANSAKTQARRMKIISDFIGGLNGG